MIDVGAQDARLSSLARWIREDLGFGDARIETASADASFRRYFRVGLGARSFIAMDAPPERESLGPFLRIANLLDGIGIHVPRVLARDTDAGFVLLTDLGSRQYLQELAAAERAPRLYGDALETLLRMQTAGAGLAAESLPRYDRALLMREMELLPQWFLDRHLQIGVDETVRAMLDRLFAALADCAAEQPFSFVHRDYHSRNLMLTEARNPGVLDFQDAVHGPVTYDLVSLLKDCYVSWPRPQVRAWALGHRDRLGAAGFALPRSDEGFLRWFDLMGLQRHIKVLGIFCRLYYRDGKSAYLADLPRVLSYVRETAAEYAESAEFGAFLAERVEPRWRAVRASA
ncbi:MAG: phosphotransferase [Gammaproteobacteria bacterium]|nr:phosphotransferase [Gammaproteobacteria bacterium]